MSRPDTTFRAGDILTAIALLSRLPVRADFSRGAQAAWAYPLTGAVVAALAALPTALTLSLGVPPTLAALVWLAANVILTGAMHEDGLSDCADGFWGGWERARRLEIMKDSRIGAYGVIALCLSLFARWGAVAIILQSTGWIWELVAVAMLSRAAMPALMTSLPHARETGLSHAQGRPAPLTALGAALLAIGATVALTGLTVLVLVPLVLLAAAACRAIAQSKIGGQTGDVMGATQQICEITLLFALAS